MKHFHNILIVNYLMLILCFDMFILDTAYSKALSRFVFGLFELPQSK